MSPPVLPLHTARLTLRRFKPADLEDVFSYMSHPDVVPYLYGGVKDLAGAEARLQKWMETTTLTGDGDRLYLAIVLAAGSPVIGQVMLKCRSREHYQAEVGYVLHPAYHGHGYATEAAAAMLDLAFQAFGFHRVVACCDARNTASYRVMERLGMRREAHFLQNEFIQGEWTDELVYALLRAEWAQRAAERAASPSRSPSPSRKSRGLGEGDAGSPERFTKLDTGGQSDQVP